MPEAADDFWNGSGTYVVGMVVDAEGAIAESNEDNNASTGVGIDYNSIEVTVPVSAPPPLPSNEAPTLTAVETLTGATEGEAFTISYQDLLDASDAADADGDVISFQIEEVLSGELTKDGETVAQQITLSEGEEVIWTPAEVGDGVSALSVKAFDGEDYSADVVEMEVEVQVAVTEPAPTGIDFKWARNIGGSGADFGRGIAADSSGNVLVTGKFHNTIDIDKDGNNDLTGNGSEDSYVAKLDSNGNLVWAKSIAGSGIDWGYGITTDSNDNVLVTGQFQNTIDIDKDGNNDLTSNGLDDSYVVKFDSSGNLVWAKNIGSSAREFSYGIATDGSDNVLVAGSFSGDPIDIDSDGNNDLTSSTRTRDSYVVKLDSNGNFVWAEDIGGNGNDYANGIATDNSGNVLLIGHFTSSIDIDKDGNYDLVGDYSTDGYVAKLDSSGNFLWAEKIGSSGTDYGHGIATDGSGNVLVTGRFQNTIDIDSDGSNDLASNGLDDSYVVKLDSNGNLVWTKNIGSSGNDQGYGVVADSTNNVFVSGHFQNTIDIDSDGSNDLTSNGQIDTYLAKLDSTGNLVWAENIGGNDGDFSWGIAIDGSDNLLASGYFYSPIDIDSDGNNDLSGNGNVDGYVIKFSDNSASTNTAPTLSNFSTLTGATEGEAFTITYEDLLAASDAADADGDAISFQIEESFSGELTKDGETIAQQITLSEGEEIVWTPAEVGDAVRALNVKAFDGKESSDTAVEVAVAVEPPAPFAELDANLAGVRYGATQWADYDNDGDLDVLITGENGSNLGVSKIYRNDNSEFNDIEADIVGVGDGSAAEWGDYDNDGDLDLVIAGETGVDNVAKIYENQNGNFVDIEANIPQLDDAAAAWGDYDNDGDLDLALSGANGNVNVSKIFQNQNGNFIDIEAALAPVAIGPDLGWGDYDNDGDLDLLLTGGVNIFSGFAGVYRNDNGNFVNINAGIPGVTTSSAAWGDYDSDGDLDILITGASPFFGSSTIYRNDGGNFVDIKAGLTGVLGSSGSWGDYDNDGDLDILLTGSNISGGVSKIYRNNNGNFVEFDAGLPDLLNGKAAYGDYDGDGDLDILLTGYDQSGVQAKIYTNNSADAANIAPTAPAGLNAVVDGGDVTFSWNAATDAETPSEGLSYNLRVGTTPSGAEVVSPMSGAGGDRLIPAKGNVDGNTGWSVKDLEPGTYYWSVQAIDSAFTGSQFATEGRFIVESPIPSNNWNARFLNRTSDNVDNRNSYDFSNPDAVLDLGAQQTDGKIALKQYWGLGSPTNGIQNDNFAMEAWTRTNFQAGKLYKITTQSDDGIWFRLKNVNTGDWVGDSVVLGSDGADWRDRETTDAPRTIFFKVPETGEYDFYVDYYEKGNDAAINFELEAAQNFSDSVNESQEWKTSVFWWDRQNGNTPPTNFHEIESNRIGQINLGSQTRADGKGGITVDWGSAAPNNDVRLPDNNFALRSYTHTYLEAGRKYEARVRGDDGFQLLAKHWDTGEWSYFTPENEWQQAYGSHQVVEFTVPQDGWYDFHFHLYEERGDAYFDLSWEPVNFGGRVIATVGANIRSGPSTSFSKVDKENFGANLTFDKWTKGEFIDYRSDLGTASDIWYRIAGTDNWISAAIVDGSP